MSNVEFEDKNLPADRFAAPGELPTLVKLVLKIGLAKNEKQANYVLIGVALCAMLLTAYVIKSSFGGARPNQNIIPPSAFPAQGGAFGNRP